MNGWMYVSGGVELLPARRGDFNGVPPYAQAAQLRGSSAG